MLSTKHITNLFFIGILVMSGFAPMLADTFEISNTFVSPLVVQFGDSVEELAAIAELRSNFPRARVVDFSEYDRIVSFKGPIIYVGHSSEEGIQYHGKTVSWDVLADMIRISKSDSHYMLGCESSKITELAKDSGKNVLSFEEKVDAIIAANYISFNLQKSFGVANKMLTRLRNLLQNPELILTMRYGEKEHNGHAIAIPVIIAMAVLPSAAFAGKIAVTKAVMYAIGSYHMFFYLMIIYSTWCQTISKNYLD